MKRLVITPTRREARALSRLNAQVCGAGADSGPGAARLIQAHRPDLVILAGYCGGLDPSLAAGGAILCRQALTSESAVHEPDRLLIDEVRRYLHTRRIPYVSSRLLSVERPVATRLEKRDLWNEYGAAGTDMESVAVVEAAERAGIGWLVVRVVIDSARQGLPRSLQSWERESSSREAVMTALTHPLDWPGYARLALAYPRANRSLARTVAAVARAAERANVVETLTMVEVAG